MGREVPTFANALDGARTIAARCLSGAMPASQREQALTWFGQRDPRLVKLITNARLLGEGIDVPAVDAICFSDRRSSVVDIVQAIGRVLRPHPDKSIARILVPVALDEQGDEDTIPGLSSSPCCGRCCVPCVPTITGSPSTLDHAARRSGHGVRRRCAALPQVRFHLAARFRARWREPEGGRQRGRRTPGSSTTPPRRLGVTAPAADASQHPHRRRSPDRRLGRQAAAGAQPRTAQPGPG